MSMICTLGSKLSILYFYIDALGREKVVLCEQGQYYRSNYFLQSHIELGSIDG